MAVKDAGIRFNVLVTESQPNCDGHVTANQLTKMGIEVKIGIEAGIGGLLPQVDLMLSGAEAITPRSSAVCKVGTYPGALVAWENAVPVFILADTLKFIPPEMQGFSSQTNPLTPQDIFENNEHKGAQIVGHIFDENPAELITGIITEKGLISPFGVVSVMREIPVSYRVNRVFLNIQTSNR